MSDGEIKIRSHNKGRGYLVRVQSVRPFMIQAFDKAQVSPPPTPPPAWDRPFFFNAALEKKSLYPAILVFLLLPVILSSKSLPLTQQADSQYQLQQYDSALVDFNQVIAEYPTKKEGYYNRGLCYYRLNRLPEAQRDFNACLQIDSVFDDARFMKILTLQKQGDWETAFIEFKMLNTNYAGYNALKKSIRYHNLSVILSRNWYYMIAIMFLFIILVGVVAKSYAVKKGF